MNLNKSIQNLLACVLMAPISANVVNAVGYTIIDLGTLGGSSSRGRDINSSGQVCGHSDISGDSVQHAFLWDPMTGVMSDLPTLPAYTAGTFATGMNNEGYVVGIAHSGSGNPFRAFVRAPGAGLTNLGTLGGNRSTAYDINVHLQVVGHSNLSGNDNNVHAYIWEDKNGNGVSDPGEMQNLGTFGGNESYCLAINDSGQAAGYAELATGKARAL